jgi:hypothetical protein
MKETNQEKTVVEAGSAGENAQQAQAVHCLLCEQGVMKRATIRPYNQLLGYFSLIVGLMFFLLGPFAPLGMVLVFVALYLILSKKDVWLCDKCGAMVERL